MASDTLQQAIRNLDQATTTPELIQATQAICALQDPDAATTLIKVLGFNNPGVASVATQGLIALGREIIPTLLVSLDARNYGARAWVVRVISALRDPRGIDVLEHALNADIAPSVPRSATRGLAELDLNQSSFDRDLERCFQCLFQAAKDDEWVVRYAAAFGLEQRLNTPSITSAQTTQALAHLQHLSSSKETVKVVRMRADLSLRRLTSR